MIVLECDNCEKTFKVDSDLAGKKAPCPHCGDVNRVPGSGEAARTRPTEGNGADAEAGAEKTLRVVRPGMFRAHPFRFLIVTGLLVGGAVLIGLSLATVVLAWLGWVGLVIAVPTVLYLLHWWFFTHRWDKLVVTNKRTIRHTGIISRHTTEVLHNHVRSVDIKQNFLERIFDVGEIGIDSAGQDEIEITIRDIPDPYEVKALIDRYRRM